MNLERHWRLGVVLAATIATFRNVTSLPFTIPGYVDAFPASAPVGKFAPNRSMVYDLGGNVAEWCHDYYDVPAAGGSGTLPSSGASCRAAS